MINTTIAILCDYTLMPERIGGMDHFFWAFQKKCTQEGIAVHWFFPNTATFKEYNHFKIYATEGVSIETAFLNHLNKSTCTYSVIFTHFLELCTPFFKKIKSNCNTKIIAVDHNPRPIKGYPTIKKIKKRIKGRLYGKYIDTFIGVSNYTVAQILNDFGTHLSKKTKTIYNGVIIDHIDVQLFRNHTCPKFLVASHLRKSKGIQDLITAVALLEESIKQKLKIDIYGDGPYKTTLKALVFKTKTTNIFQFKGNSPHLNAIYAKYDYMLQPTHMECFSLSILESLAANVPVITTNVGGNEEAVFNGENGFIYTSTNSYQLKEIITDIYNGNKKIESNTRENIERNFSIKLMVENYYALITN